MSKNAVNFFRSTSKLITLFGLVPNLLLFASYAIATPASEVSVFDTATQISKSSSGALANAESTRCSLGEDARYITFESIATNLISPATNGQRQIYLRDTTLNSTQLISAISTSSVTGGNAASQYPVVTPNGQFVVFQSDASNIVAGDTNASSDIFVRSVSSPASTARVSIADPDGASAQGNANSFYPDISDDGKYITYMSEASNLVTTDNDFFTDIFVVDRTTGQVERISVAANGGSPNGSSSAGSPAISGNGRYVVFGSNATNIIAGDTNGRADVFVRDRTNSTNERISIPPTGSSFSSSVTPLALGPGSISRDGRYVGFGVDSDGDAFVDQLYLHDRNSHTSIKLADSGSEMMHISSSGRKATFFSVDNDIVSGATTGGVFFVDLQINQFQLMQARENSEFHESCISRDGATIGFEKLTSGTKQIYLTSSDLCPADTSKTAPGICGCGVADTDTDSDGTANCLDQCPNNAIKIVPGVCGCSVADIDTDSDGTLNCLDNCPNNPNKTQPGSCGCNVADTDTDGDGTANCIDGCPNDRNKITPAICGCGVSEVDSDEDSVLDCEDSCPRDPEKTIPAICGCGIVETPGCADLCPDDTAKRAPGECGCGTADTDSDQDDTADCLDQCPNDPEKTEPGSCGCGAIDQDQDQDQISDCLESGGGSKLTAAAVSVRGNSTNILVDNLASEDVRYRFVLKAKTKGLRGATYQVKSNKITLQYLKKGSYELRYYLINLSSVPISKSKLSPRTLFRTTRNPGNRRIRLIERRATSNGIS